MLPLAADAQVHKCVANESIVYRDTPCNDGQAPVVARQKIPAPSERAVRVESQPRADSDSAPLAMPERSIVLPAPGTAISLGMTDLEVLNLRGWGPPSKIARSKVDGVWREQWTYKSAARGLQPVLQFVNARLAAIEAEPGASPQPTTVRAAADASLSALVRVVVTDIPN
jgi:hypothetical protein